MLWMGLFCFSESTCYGRVVVWCYMSPGCLLGLIALCLGLGFVHAQRAVGYWNGLMDCLIVLNYALLGVVGSFA